MSSSSREVHAAASTRIWSSIDLDRSGKYFGHLHLPYSTDLSAYGTIPIPIISICNGDGPTALLIAGSHGDEYEGQVALSKLARSIDPQDVCGRILILPHLNLPAVQAGRRLSPLDDGNLNRLFPGEANGSPTLMIAHFISTVLLPIADVVLDLHSGGRSLEYLPCSMIRTGGNRTETQVLIDLANVFGAPICSMSDGSGGGGGATLSAVSGALGIPCLTAELGGGVFSPDGERLGREGCFRVLAYMGVLRSDISSCPRTETRFVTVEGRDAFIYAPIAGIFEPTVTVGTPVQDGVIGGYLHGFEGREPFAITFTRNGTVACRRAISATSHGDCLFKLVNAVDVD